MYNKKPIIIVSIIAAVVILIVVCVFTPLLNIISSWIGNVVTPIQSGITGVTNSISRTFQTWANHKNLYAENESLKEEIDILKNENRKYLTYKNENERLKSLLDLKDQLEELAPVAASVIGKDAGNWFNVFTIDKGSNAMIVENTPVVNSNGLIGRVLSTGDNWSKVITVIDRDHSVSGKISRTGDFVQIDGDLELMKSGLCKMTIITEDADVIVGDTVVTSGIGGIYPEGLFIGTVTEFRNNENGTGKYAVVKPEVDFQHIFDVLLLTRTEE